MRASPDNPATRQAPDRHPPSDQPFGSEDAERPFHLGEGYVKKPSHDPLLTRDAMRDERGRIKATKAGKSSSETSVGLPLRSLP